MEAWRWTTNTARPSKWAALSEEAFGHERFVKLLIGEANGHKVTKEMNSHEYELMYLVMKQVPESVDKTGEQRCVTKQHADEPAGPQALSADTQNI